MTQRSFSNERYRKDAKIGSTRKSAAKAKPKREAGSAVSTASKQAASDKREAERKAARKAAWKLPSTPEIDRWRKIWWAFLGVAIVGFAGGLYGQNEGIFILAQVGLAVEVVAVLAAIYIDLFVVRKLRKELLAQAEGKKAGKKSTKEEARPAGKDPS